MAASSSTLPSVSPTLPQVHRTDSLGSNVSAGSLASLSRRPRTKSRPRAVTVSPRRDKSPASAGNLEASKALAKEQLADVSISSPSTMSPNAYSPAVPSRPPRSPLRAATFPKDDISHPDMLPSSAWKTVDDIESSWRSRAVKIEDSASQRRKRGSSVPRDAFRLSMLSSASSAQTNAFFTTLGQMQTVPHFTSLREARQRLRESNVTVQSGTASSVYPLSSSTISGTESPSSPRSIADSFQDNHISSVDPDEPYDDYQAFHADDVSYRLRLLVSNNYFLPPAHSKPSPSDFASPVAAPSKKSVKSVGPAFLDIFRVGRARSKPTTSTGRVTPDVGPPRLRTTADSTITSSRAPVSHVDPVSRSPMVPTLAAQATRVAVVREKVDDLALAAEQAEQELKMRVDAKHQSTEHFDNYVDPTDAVDLPPPSENSPFAFQASVLRGLGVENSLGAAVLAERLPPGSPGVWSLDPDEEAWRKALLHEAVGHSLNSTPAHSFHTSSHAATPSSGSMEPSFAQSSPSPGLRTSTPSMKRNLGQRIVEILDEQHESIVDEPPTIPSGETLLVPVSQARVRTVSATSHISQLPLRAETPAEPQTALPPPPRTPAKLPRASLSIESPGESHRLSQYSMSASVLRKTSSSPMLHLWHESASRRSRAVVSMTPPLLPRGRASSVATSPGGFMPRDSMTSGSHYSVQDPESVDHLAEPEPLTTRPSFSSLPSRPSFSEYSQISPTVSAFNDGRFSSAFSFRESMVTDDAADLREGEVSQDAEEPTRHLSPPPRTSSSLAMHSLHPPPRFPLSREPSPTLVVARLPIPVSRLSISSSDPGDSSERPSLYATANEQPDAVALELDLSSLSIPSSMHNAPPPASPLEFFDQIQTDRNVMDDWETSDESDADVGNSAYVEETGRTTPQGSSQSHSSLMHTARVTSTQSLSPSSLHDDLSVHTGSQERQPVANVPRPAIYFKDSKIDQTLSSYDLYRLSRSAVALSSRASSDTQARGGSGEDKNFSKREGRTASMQRLDGLMLQHIEAERGTLSRITKTVKDAHS
ncbi:hypothetical protein B0F90DRAFT_1708456 [Multifurca ochricompacta]|uniref:Uncharacterized protein n=1 Tax=Multifurca ochricompacta TaxID=376703 RepID=A0AAD4M730_9AGAM|nr:hypothetical protein B0F90DRAFT_1708456 [Multifurca ochricompacta]